MPEAKHPSQRVEQVACAVLTVSDTRTRETDRSGAIIRQALESAGHRVLDYLILRDDPGEIRDRVLSLCGRADCQALLISGGTGLAPRDSTFEAISAVLEKKLDGFGELFRMLSFEEIGAAAMLSRALAGVCRGTVLFSMPGSTGAVRLAMERLILPQLGHAVWLLSH